MREVSFTFWNRWRNPRTERTADGTTTVYFGLGRLTLGAVVETYSEEDWRGLDAGES